MKSFVSCCLVVLASASYAQIMTNPTQWYINTQRYSIRAFNGMVANSMIRNATGKKSKPIAPAAAKATSFQWAAPSLPKLLASKMEGGDKSKIESFFQSHIDLYRQVASKDGFPSNDLAYAFEYFVVNNYHLHHELIGSPKGVTMSQERAVYNQFKNILASNAGVKKMTSAQKQQATEVLAIMFGVNYSAYANRSNGPEIYAQARQQAKEQLEQLLGAKIDQIKITNKGLEL